jgi:hypothetical protein
MKFYDFEEDGGDPTVVRLSKVTAALPFGPEYAPVQIPPQIRVRLNKRNTDFCVTFKNEGQRDKAYARFIAALEDHG